VARASPDFSGHQNECEFERLPNGDPLRPDQPLIDMTESALQTRVGSDEAVTDDPSTGFQRGRLYCGHGRRWPRTGSPSFSAERLGNARKRDMDDSAPVDPPAPGERHNL
jgi:hypothetical protein